MKLIKLVIVFLFLLPLITGTCRDEAGKCTREDIEIAQYIEIDRSTISKQENYYNYRVRIRNLCKHSAATNLYVECRNFYSSTPIDPMAFRVVVPGVCLVKNGTALSPGETYEFVYARHRPYSFGRIQTTFCT